MPNTDEKLYLRFHGRIIDSLGIQMYQSPVAAVAELIANAWDADATRVTVTLPSSLSGSAEIVVKDDGIGMTFSECQRFYLDVGRNRRITPSTPVDENSSDDDASGDASQGGRPILGRKGIGKFAGFGIAELLEVDTTSSRTGERTVFQLDLSSTYGATLTSSRNQKKCPSSVETGQTRIERSTKEPG